MNFVSCSYSVNGKTEDIRLINNLIETIQRDVRALQIIKGDDAKYIIEFYQLYTRILKMEKLAMSVDNNPLLMSKIHSKYQECFSDVLVVLEDAVKVNDIDEKFYLDCADFCKKQYTEFKDFYEIDLKTY
jgi:hypothetical protein